MTLQDFISSTSQAQLYIVGEQGKRLHQHVSIEYTITLYRIENFFVQVFFNRQELRITQLRAFPAEALTHYYHEEAELILAEEAAAGTRQNPRTDPDQVEGTAPFIAWKPSQNTRENKGNKL